MSPLGPAALGYLARMICGGQPYRCFPYRDAARLQAFFAALGLEEAFEEPLRYFTTRELLDRLNEGEPAAGLPPAPLVRIIEALLAEASFPTSKRKLRPEAWDLMNRTLAPCGLTVIDEAGAPNLTIIDEAGAPNLKA